MMPNGMYTMRPQVDKAQFGKAGAGGTTLQVAIPLVVVETTQYKDQIVMWTGNLAPDNLKITMDNLKTLGWDGSKPVGQLRGVGTRDVQVIIENDPQYGPKVKSLREPGKQFWRGGQMSAQEVADLDSLLDGAVAPPRRPAGQQSYAPRNPPATTQPGGSGWDGQGADPTSGAGTDDDIPF